MQPNLSAGRQRLPDRSRKAAGGAHISRAASCGREQRELCVKGRERRGRNGAQRAPAGEREVVRKKERISSSAHLSKSRAAEPGRAGDRGKRRRIKAEAMEAVAFKVAACRAPASSEARARPDRQSVQRRRRVRSVHGGPASYSTRRAGLAWRLAPLPFSFSPSLSTKEPGGRWRSGARPRSATAEL